MKWIAAHWELIALVLGVLVSLLNAATRHWSEKTGLVKVLLFIVDCLSIIRSKGTAGSVLGNAKLPLIPTSSTGVVDGKLILPLMLLSLVVPGCATWQQTAKVSLDSAGVAADLARTVAEPYYNAQCEAAARACAAAKIPDCPALVACQSERHKVYLAILAVHAARVPGYSALSGNDKTGALGIVARVVKLATDLTAALRAAKVLP